MLAVVENVDRHLGVLTISGSGLDQVPLGASQALVFKDDALGAKKVADSLSAGLDWEVEKLGHS